MRIHTCHFCLQDFNCDNIECAGDNIAQVCPDCFTPEMAERLISGLTEFDREGGRGVYYEGRGQKERKESQMDKLRDNS